MLSKSMLAAVAALVAVGAAFAAEPTVSLSQAELQALIQAEAAKAVANFIAQQEGAKAAPAYEKIKAAFAAPAPLPTPEAKP